jgi:hypothetical protein
MKERKDLKPEDIPHDSTTLVIINEVVFELENSSEQEQFGISDEYC